MILQTQIEADMQKRWKVVNATHFYCAQTQCNLHLFLVKLSSAHKMQNTNSVNAFNIQSTI